VGRPRRPNYTHRFVGARLRRAIKRALLRARFPFRRTVLRLGLRAYELYLALPLPGRRTPDRAPDRWPIPPPALRAKVSWPADARFFLESGRTQAELIRGVVSRNGGDVAGMEAILDFGCGCGRLARWWSEVPGPTIHGCDYNPDLVEWCAANLTFMRTAVNRLEPPLPYGAERFDLVYALSVFTHMSEELQDRWLAELRRVLRPGGLLFFTVSGDAYAEKLSPEDRVRYGHANLVTHFTDVEGSNLCAAYHPPAYVRTHMVDRLELVAEVPGGRGSGAAMLQDGYLVRRPLSSPANRRTRRDAASPAGPPDAAG
jgi:SAM-dependent methyltransferase